MRRHPPHALYGALMLAMMVGLLFGVVVYRSADGAVTVSTSFDTIGGSISSGADVKLRGYVVGKVASVSRRSSGGVDMTLDIFHDDFDQIPQEVVARILPATVFGTTFVELVPIGGTDARLEAGATVPQDLRAPTLELQRALDGIDQLVDALGPAELSTVLTALATSLDGRGRAIGDSIDKLNHVAEVLTPEVPLVRDNLRLLAENLRTLRDVAPELLDAIDDTVVVADHLVERKVRLKELITSALALIDDSGDLVDRTSAKFTRNIVGAAILIDAVYDNRDDLQRLPGSVDNLLSKLLTVTDGGVVRIDATLVDVAPGYYTAADCPRYGSTPGRNCR